MLVMYVTVIIMYNKFHLYISLLRTQGEQISLGEQFPGGLRRLVPSPPLPSRILHL